jgi:alpha-1,2-mannosyltransferase
VAVRERVATRLAQAPAAVQRRTAKQLGVVVALFLCTWAFDAAMAVRHGFFDLKVYYGALNYWMHGTGEIYDYLLAPTKYGFTYPPFAALMMLPMAYVSWHVAIAISMVLTVGASVAVLYWLVEPLARRHGWNRWFAVGIASALAVAFEPLRETFLFGQVNSVLLAVVAADLLLLVRYNRSIAGVGIGIAAAIKLTPGIFIVYLLVTKRYRAAAVASGTTLVATLLAGAVAPDASREFWTDALWNTGRVGSQAFVSNQSLSGVIHRWDPQQPAKLLWLALVLLVLAVWAWRSRRAVRHGDEATGLALTGLVGVLISPITWVHHLVWVLPAIVLLVDRGLVAGLSRGRRRWLLGLAAVTYLVMCSRLVWVFSGRFETLGGWLGSNAYVWLSLIMLFALPVRTAVAPTAVPRSGRPVADVPDVAELDRRLAAIVDSKRPRIPAQDEAGLLVDQPARRLVGADHP